MPEGIRPFLAMFVSLMCFGLLASIVRGLTIRRNLQAPHIVLYSLPFSLAALLLGIVLEDRQHSIAGLFTGSRLPVLTIGILSPFSYFLFFSGAFEALGKRSYEAYSINALWPILAVIFSIIVTGEKVEIARWLVLGLGFIGALWIITEGEPARLASLHSNWTQGDLLALFAACTFGLYTALLGTQTIKSSADNLGWTTAVLGFQLVSFVCALGYFLISRQPWVIPDRAELGLVMGAGALSFGLAYPLFFFARSRLDLVTFAVFQNFLPFLALLLLALFFPRERAPGAYWVGVAIVAAANLLNVFFGLPRG